MVPSIVINRNPGSKAGRKADALPILAQYVKVVTAAGQVVFAPTYKICIFDHDENDQLEYGNLFKKNFVRTTGSSRMGLKHALFRAFTVFRSPPDNGNKGK